MQQESVDGVTHDELSSALAANDQVIKTARGRNAPRPISRADACWTLARFTRPETPSASAKATRCSVGRQSALCRAGSRSTRATASGMSFGSSQLVVYQTLAFCTKAQATRKRPLGIEHFRVLN